MTPASLQSSFYDSQLSLETLSIPVYVTNFRQENKNCQSGRNKSNLRSIKRNNKMLEAANLPNIVVLNPRSLYNKQSNFITLIEQTDAGVCFISETWDRSHKENSNLITDLIKIDGYVWVKSVHERNCGGGKPALLINENEFFITELSPDPITVPVGVEAVWAMLIPRSKLKSTNVRKIIVGSVYYSSKQTKKDDFIDHLADVFHTLSSKYGPDIKFIIGGDYNRLNLKPILNLTPDFKQVVNVPTRRNPDAILDKIVTNIHALYQPPTTLLPLENDDDKTGKPSDHLICIMRPISTGIPPSVKYKQIKFRRFPDSALREMGRWLQGQNWHEVYMLTCPNQKAEKFESILMEKINLYFPEKVIKVNSNDKPWVDRKLLQIDRQRKREYNKRKRSEKWKKLNNLFHERAKILKENYYKDRVEDLKTSNISQWYSRLKRMSSIDQTKEGDVEVQDLVEFPNQEQAEMIADQYAKISNQYKPLKSEDLDCSNMTDSKPLPLFDPYQVYLKIKKMKKKSSTILNDVPWKVIYEYSVELSEPLCHIFNSAILDGIWPNSWKREVVTPVPKVFPPKKASDLRKISGTKNFSKILEALLSDSIIGDIQQSIDPSQYGNEKGLSTVHYLIKMIHSILETLDTNNATHKNAVIAQLIDWSQAFDRQDAKLGLEAFMKCGVRQSLIPLLTSFFQDRKMVVKWHGCLSSERELPGGVPQGSLFGNLQYKVSSNSNADHASPEMKFKFVDDLSLLEKLNLILAGISSYNFRNHVASDIGTHQHYIPSQNLKSQESLDNIQEWTKKNLAKLNVQKSKIMIFN